MTDYHMTPTKPRTYAECMNLVAQGDIEILLVDFRGPSEDTDIILLVHDHRRTHEEGEIYQVNYPNPESANRYD